MINVKLPHRRVPMGDGKVHNVAWSVDVDNFEVLPGYGAYVDNLTTCFFVLHLFSPHLSGRL